MFLLLLLSAIVCVSHRYLKITSAAEALKLLAAGSQPPHLVLLDAALPDTTDTTGLEVLQTIRQHLSQAVLPVIMLTARHNEKAIVQALDAGANDYAVKPFRRAELLARIRMHLRSSQKAAAAAATAGQQAAAEFGFAGQDGDEERLSAELQRSVSLQQLSSVPLLVIQLGGVSEALAGASAEQACQLMGYIADCFDALAEKYAVLKVGVCCCHGSCVGFWVCTGVHKAPSTLCLHAAAAHYPSSLTNVAVLIAACRLCCCYSAD